MYNIVISPTILTDTVIINGDPLYEVPVTHTSPGMDPTTTSLCYQVHGKNGSYYNLISDDCLQMNVLYAAMKNLEDGNFLKEIGILARDTENNCIEIKLHSNRCNPIINGIAFNKSYNTNGIKIIKTEKRVFEVTVPNCKAKTQGDDIKFKIACQKLRDRKVVHFSVMRGSGIKPGAHGLVGKCHTKILGAIFWDNPYY